MAFNFYDIIKKFVCFLTIVMCVGLPATGVLSFIILFISALVIVTGQINRSHKRFIAVLIIGVSILLAKGLLPHAAIQEGHNIFWTKTSDEVLENQLPPEVFGFMKQQFLKRYPLDEGEVSRDTDEYRLNPAPSSLFAFSADSTFSNPKYSRIVDTINFKNLTEFRGGFANSRDYNWFGDSDINRNSLPFFVMYELTKASINSSLCWTGYVFWEQPDGYYQAMYHRQKECRKITESDIGKKVFGVSIYNKSQLGFWGRFNEVKSKIKYFFLPKKQMQLAQNDNETYLSMHLKLSPLLTFSLILKIIREILSVLAILYLMIKMNRNRFITAFFIIGIAAFITYLYCPELFGQYYIHEGGEDGLTHHTLGRQVLINATSGDWMQALRGEQDIFWDTPGFRYFRALEKLFFGDTNFGYLAVLLIFPYILFGFLANFISKKWAFWATIVFLLGFLPLHVLDNLGFTYYIYVMVVRGGWPDTLAFATFLGGLTLLLRYAKVQNGEYYWYGFLANFLLAITVFMRPQFVVTVLIIGTYFTYVLIRERRFRELLFSLLGFLPIFFPLWHNYFFGQKLYFFTGAAHLSVNFPPSLYFSALRELLASNFSGQDLSKIVLHIKEMIGPWYRLILLGAVFYAAFFKRQVPMQIRMIAIACLSLHFVGLFIFAVYFRYVYLVWALSVIIAIYLVWSFLKEHISTIQGKKRKSVNIT